VSSIVDGWLESARADLKNIEYIIHDADLAHIVAFHSQQCVEFCNHCTTGDDCTRSYGDS
jgi:HEPN domain-containing protein